MRKSIARHDNETPPCDGIKRLERKVSPEKVSFCPYHHHLVGLTRGLAIRFTSTLVLSFLALFSTAVTQTYKVAQDRLNSRPTPVPPPAMPPHRPLSLPRYRHSSWSVAASP
ncbi:uncharacterized protein BT62DRAFT_583738 [Guyanagaster necrorhizus]|uniref:Uncharacterized protein n=1 Tax=Guyanagaster necrorhizus TaxID=856835 RepID=A0A9P8ALP9_9AGAR|nr:uncharacterized protein BT62DRAFT_583738 [Guyanagaster necrorhizus MCA 3950]KAG7440448.1 hypothetical protein BT62DRAFT_583738 [Guyanagaster necrorhizus MCA 3950]